MHRVTKAVAILALLAAQTILPASAQMKTRNVVLIVSDGLRWQEVFNGAERELMNNEHGGVSDPKALQRDFWRDDALERRKALFPFLWGVVAKQGQIYGNLTKCSVARVTNSRAFSYPGYNEMLTGSVDSRVDSNEFGPNPNVTVFEWLNHLPEFHNQVAVFGTWNTFNDIFNQKRSGLVVHAGWEQPQEITHAPREQLFNQLYRDLPRSFDDVAYDAFLQVQLLDYLQANHPRVLFVGYGETDEWAHAGRYDLVLRSANKFDYFVEQLWNTMQSIPDYRDNTTFILTTDHGRGTGLVDWQEHGVRQKGSENIWIAVMGPATPALGERANTTLVTQAQIASTVAAFLGVEYRLNMPNVAPPLAAAFKQAVRSGDMNRAPHQVVGKWLHTDCRF